MAREREASRRLAKCHKIQVVFDIQTQKRSNEAAAARHAAKKQLNFAKMKPCTDIQNIEDGPGQKKPLMKELNWNTSSRASITPMRRKILSTT
ncbi:hypothetical protein BOTBODRAFT_174573 [Botryobasidium botryosum FD-172 SS1]|uniref:Uncharacterized protein n=1 Tax=Botryobasidium botryosum (strain FD-172 SS1) TaxID=930990 RepID=A0A067MSB2_BOTB1|nr:hypothetical protein BOTBODRAFT_174573 [Botryobasidium botryosum FD-172 SS1]